MPIVLIDFSEWPQLWEVGSHYPHFASEESEARKFKELYQSHSLQGVGAEAGLEPNQFAEPHALVSANCREAGTASCIPLPSLPILIIVAVIILVSTLHTSSLTLHINPHVVWWPYLSTATFQGDRVHYHSFIDHQWLSSHLAPALACDCDLWA